MLGGGGGGFDPLTLEEILPIYLFAESHEKIIWFHISVDKILPMNKLNTAYLKKTLYNSLFFFVKFMTVL